MTGGRVCRNSLQPAQSGAIISGYAPAFAGLFVFS